MLDEAGSKCQEPLNLPVPRVPLPSIVLLCSSQRSPMPSLWSWFPNGIHLVSISFSHFRTWITVTTLWFAVWYFLRQSRNLWWRDCFLLELRMTEARNQHRMLCTVSESICSNQWQPFRSSIECKILALLLTLFETIKWPSSKRTFLCEKSESKVSRAQITWTKRLHSFWCTFEHSIRPVSEKESAAKKCCFICCETWRAFLDSLGGSPPQKTKTCSETSPSEWNATSTEYFASINVTTQARVLQRGIGSTQCFFWFGSWECHCLLPPV